MKIVKRLRINGAAEVNAVLLNDEGEEYPVFLDSLHNTIIFPTLLSSGYVLAALPYGFVKDGVSLDSLPEENYTVDNIQLEMMYNSIGIKMSYEDLKANIKEEVATGLPLPETNYTIFTREDLLKYLDMTSIASLEDDFMPLNYFVAPEARFSVEEYMDNDNIKYIHLINKRREMTLTKFYKLVERLSTINLCANPTPMDVLDAYFAWGLDGLDMPIIHKTRESRPFRLMANRNVNAPIIRRTFGFVDGARNLLVPENERNVQWKPVLDADALEGYVTGMQFDDTKVLEFKTPARQDVTTLEGTRCNIRYSEETLIFQTQTYPSISVKSPAAVGSFLDLKLAMPNNKEQLYEHCKLEALSKMLYEYRKPNVRISSYDALLVSGCNPKTALRYVTGKCNMSKERRVLTEDSTPVIHDFDIEAFLSGKLEDEDIKDVLSDIMNGVFNIDMIDSGKQAEASVSLSTTYRELYALHHVFNIPLTEMYERFKAITPNDKVITFHYNNMYHNVDVTPLKFTERGYKQDIQNYDLTNAKECSFFTYVTQVAREVGSEEARRHVGLEFYLVNRSNKEVEGIIQQLVDKYEEKVYTNIPDVTKQVNALKFTYMFALSRYYEICFKNTITYPPMVGGEVEPAMPSLVTTCRKHLERRIDSLPAYCDFTAYFNKNVVSFNTYCVNAYITPEYVIPRGNTKIHEAPFYALWFDWGRTNPELWGQLVERGVISQDFVAWENRYHTEQYVQRDLFELDSIDSLMHYYNFAIEEVRNYPDDREFVAITHPNDYMFPGIHLNGNPYEDMTKLNVPRQGEPVIRLGYVREITLDDYKDKLFPTEDVAVKDSYIRPYKGLDAAALISVRNVFESFPGDGMADLVVDEKSETVYVPDTKTTMNFRRITELDFTKYPITHVCDRLYLLRTTDGKLWEVRI